MGQDQASKGPVPYPKRWSRRQGYAFVTNMAEPPRGDSSVLAYTVTPLGRLPCVLHPKKGEKRPYRSILSAHPAAGNTKENYALKVGPLWPPCSLLCQAAHCGPAGRAPGPAPIGAYGTWGTGGLLYLTNAAGGGTKARPPCCSFPRTYATYLRYVLTHTHMHNHRFLYPHSNK